MKNIFPFIFSLISFSAIAQIYPVGVRTITWTDPARSNRSIAVELHYPAVSAGSNTAVANDSFPFVVFGHGFQITVGSYPAYYDTLAKLGYIVAMPTTEGSLSPSHADFAKDFIFVYNKLISESNTNNASPFYQKVVAKGAIGGHSMGGGSTVLSCQYSNPATCYFTFAAANTNPSSIAASKFMTKPYLDFAGTRDCVAPPAANQLAMYDSSTSPCKYYINIKDATHCQFSATNATLCFLGEGVSFCSNTPLSITQQQSQVFNYLLPYLKYYLKGDCAAWTQFESVYAADAVNTKLASCNNVIPYNASISGNNYFCNGSSTTLTASPSAFNYVWNDNSTSDTLSVSSVGNYSVVVGNGVCSLPAVSVSVTENFLPATPSAITASDTVCSNIANINISVLNDVNATIYNWTLPNGWNITSGNNTNAIEATSDISGGNISVTAENDCGISSAVQKTVTVIPSNLGTLGTIAGDTLFCEGETAQFNIASVSGADSYVWTFPLGWLLVSNNAETVSSLVFSGSGSVSVQAVNNCGQSIPSLLNVAVTDTPEVTISVQGNQLVSQPSGSSYQWYLDGVAINGETDSSIIPQQTGNYSVVVTDSNGCSGVSQALNFILTGMPETETDVFSIYPNPNSTGKLQFKVTEDWLGAEVKIFDMEGSIVMTSEIRSQKSEKNISNLKSGVYMANIEKGGQKLRKRIVIQ